MNCPDVFEPRSGTNGTIFLKRHPIATKTIIIRGKEAEFGELSILDHNALLNEMIDLLINRKRRFEMK